MYSTLASLLSVNAGLSIAAITKATSRARRLVGHFQKCPLAAAELTQKQKQLGFPEHSLVQDVTIRWNSTYFMFERLL